MSDRPYLHGDTHREQQRLIQQADQWAALLASNLELHAHETLLEIGCGTGAVLAQIGREHPLARLCGIDISQKQIDGARRHLHPLGPDRVDLRLADGTSLPWSEGDIDRIRMVWVVEHLPNPLLVLREAQRVLRPGGTIHITETDYASLRVSPPNPAIEAMVGAFIAHFNRHGNAHAGPSLGPLLEQAGFQEVNNTLVGVHHWCPSQAQTVTRFCRYLLDFIEPERDALCAAAHDSAAAASIDKGLKHLALLGERPDAAISLNVYQARAMKGT